MTSSKAGGGGMTSLLWGASVANEAGAVFLSVSRVRGMYSASGEVRAVLARLVSDEVGPALWSALLMSRLFLAPRAVSGSELVAAGC